MYIDGNSLVWSRSDGHSCFTLLKTFSQQNEIEDGLWCNFIKDEDQRLSCISIWDKECLQIFSDSGEHFPIRIPFDVSRLMCTSMGLFVMRKPPVNESTPLPLLYSLNHPLTDITPVLLRRLPKLPQGAFYITQDSKLDVVGVTQDGMVCVLYHRSEGLHSFWLLRNVLEEELEATGASLNLDLSMNPPEDRHSFLSPLKNSSDSHSKHHSSFQQFSPSLNRSISFSLSPSTSFSSLKKSRLGGAVPSPVHLRSAAGSSPSFPGPSPPLLSPAESRKVSRGTLFSSGNMSTCSTPRALDLSITEDNQDPIYPEQCLEYMWTEPFETIDGMASKIFTTKDLVGNSFLCLLVSSVNQLRVVKITSKSGDKMIFGGVELIPAKDVEDIPSNNMMIILDPSDTLVLYSGYTRVSVLFIPSLSVPTYGQMSSPKTRLKSSFVFMSPENVKRASLMTSSRPASVVSHRPAFSVEDQVISPVLNPVEANRFFGQNHNQLSNIISVSDGIADRVTVETGDSRHFRFCLPPLVTSTVVKMSLQFLEAVLPSDLSLELNIKWYAMRNVSGGNDIPDPREVELFKRCLLSLMGYEVEDLNVSNVFLNSPPESSKRPKLEVQVQGTEADSTWFKSELESDVLESCSNNILTPTPSSILFPYLPYIMYSLHLMYEELKLHKHLWTSAGQMMDLLYLFATDLKKVSYQDHYWRDFPQICCQMNSASRIPEEDVRAFIYPKYFTETPPSIYSFLLSLLKTDSYTKMCPFPLIPFASNRTRIIILIYSCLRNEKFSEVDFVQKIVGDESSAQTLFETKGIQSREERVLNAMITFGLSPCDLETFPSGISCILWQSIFSCRKEPKAEWNSRNFSLIGRPDLSALSQKESKSCPKSGSEGEVDDDGMSYLNHEGLDLLFPDDQRISEAYDMLQSSRPVKISITQRPGVTDHDFIEEQEKHLYTICIRTMALGVGRGMLTLRSFQPVVAEMFPIPKLCLSGRVPPRNQSVELTHIDVPLNMNMWPLFHNGVAAGLRACSSGHGIDSSWIVYNRPKSSSSQTVTDAQNEHAGFLLALGLNGHLSKLSTMNIHDYLCRGNELTRVAVLLGMAAAKRSTMDTVAVKMLSIHVEALLPPTSTELDVPPVVQVAAVLGVGLLYLGSGQTHVAEVLLGEIGRPPGPEMEHYIDRESYSLAAGISFGLVTLGQGNRMVSLLSSSSDRQQSLSMADQLCNYMIGGHKKPLTTVQREKYKTPSYQIREGDYVNSDVTSPGATLALGMLFFDTQNEAVLKWVAAPDTQHLLETVRPDFLLLRTLAKGLILWSRIEATREWVDSHVPQVVAEFAFQRQANYNPRIDYETMSQAYCNIVAGACMALGLRHAGTADPDAFKVVMGYTKMFLSLPNRGQAVDQVGRSTIESCLNVLVISLALIMAGTGNLEVMRICRYLRSRTAQVNVVLYGSHMATHMALGFLFLGGCRYTFSTSAPSVAALICALFPKFPIHSNDNRYHLQAFRHLYVLAAEPRLIIPRDITTGIHAYLNIRVRWKKNGTWTQLRAPCLVPELSLLDRVVVEDKRYWKISFERSKNWHILQSVIYFCDPSFISCFYPFITSCRS